jgi:hypothetical protein
MDPVHERSRYGDHEYFILIACLWQLEELIDNEGSDFLFLCLCFSSETVNDRQCQLFVG